MRFFELLNFQHVALYLFPSLVFLVLFWAGLGYVHFHTRDSEKRTERIYGTYVEGLSTRNAPFPLALILIILGTIIWAFFYILTVGLLGVKI
jgi:hypothetical protein